MRPPRLLRFADFSRDGTAVNHRQWTRAALIGVIPGLMLHVWMLSAGSWNLFRWSRQSDFYDVQARALIDGTFAMNQQVLGIESFARGDQHFMYFGPVPALLRLPIVAVTRQLDGRMSAVSMLASLVVTVLALLALGWRLRRRVMANTDLDAKVSAFESVAVASTFFCLIGGSSLIYASSRTWVYHEAILWGVAFTLASLAALLRWLDQRSVSALVWASVFALLAIMTRPSVGGGALAALSLVAAQELVRIWRSTQNASHSTTSGAPDEHDDALVSRRGGSALLIAVVVLPVLMYSSVNWLKFRRLLGVPFDQQGYTLLSQQRRDMLEANGGTLFNPNFVPTNLVTYLRPDLVGLDATFPFIEPTRPETTIGSPVYDLIDLTSGVTATMPLLVLLALIGTWAVVRRPDPTVRAVWPLQAGCVLGAGAVLVIGYLANRYQSDFFPLLAVSALIGLPVTVHWQTGRRATESAVSRTVGGSILVGLAAVGCLVNLALGYSYQRAYGPSTHPDVVSSYVEMQRSVDRILGDGVLGDVSQAATLTDDSALGDLAIIGDCEGLYLSDGGKSADGALTMWRLVERSTTNGSVRGSIVLDVDQRAAAPLVHVTNAGSRITVALEVDNSGGVMTALALADGAVTRGPALPLRVGTSVAWEVFADPILGRFEVFVDGRFALFTELLISDDAVGVTVGRNVDELDEVMAVASIVDDSASFTGACEGLFADLARLDDTDASASVDTAASSTLMFLAGDG